MTSFSKVSDLIFLGEGGGVHGTGFGFCGERFDCSQ